jgi:hypothetical protein
MDRSAYKILMRKAEGRDHWKDLDLNGRIILKGWSNVDWVHLSRDRDQWRVIVKIVMNLRVAAEGRVASQEGLCSVELVTSDTRSVGHTDWL